MESEESRQCLYLAVILRLAVLLHRSHSDEPLPQLLLSGKEMKLKLNCPDDWLDTHPLTQADLEQEIGRLDAVKFRLEVV